MESFFSSLKIERVSRKVYRKRNEARADMFDYVERFYNPRRRHSTLGFLSPADFEPSFGRQIDALDIGCGTGRYFRHLRNVRRLVGLDLSSHMLEQARVPVGRTMSR